MTDTEIKEMDKQIVDILQQHTDDTMLAVGILANLAANISYQLGIPQEVYEQICQATGEVVYSQDGPILM